MSAVLCVITFSIQKHGGAMLTGSNLPLSSRIGNALISYMRYIGKMFWPRHLAGLYLRSGGWSLWQAALAALALVGQRVYRDGPETHWLLLKLRYGNVQARRSAALQVHRSEGTAMLQNILGTIFSSRAG